MKIKLNLNINLVNLLLVAFFFRIAISFFGTYQLDQNTYIAWANNLGRVGFANFYSDNWSDYLPGFLYVLRFLNIIESFKLIPNVLLYKLPAIFVDILTGLLVYKIVLKITKKQKQALLFAVLFLFNPAIWGNSSIWGQVDIFSAFFPLAALYFINNPISAVLLAFGGLVKPQSAMAIPVVLAVMLSERWKIKKIFSYWGIVGIVFLLGFLPFSNNPNLVEFILDRISTTLNQYQYGSVNAFNYWGLFGFWQKDTVGLISANLFGNLLAVGFSILVFLRLARKRTNKYFALAILLAVNFLLMTRMHERHFLPALVPLLIAASNFNFLLIIYGIFSFTYIANLYYAYQYAGLNHTFYIPEFGVKLFIIINLISFAFMLFIFLKNHTKSFAFKWASKNIKDKLPKDIVSKKKTNKLLKLVLLFALITRLFNLGYPQDYYFDEIYHSFTAKEILHGSSKPWYWGNKNPEGLAYEWTHPQLGKEIMAASMLIIGETSFAWRIPGALLGVGIIFFVFRIALQLTKSRDIALLSAAFIALDGLNFTMSRIGTVDVYYLFFALVTLSLFLDKKHFWSAVFFGLAISSKWSAIYLLPVLSLIFFVEKRKIKLKYFTYIFIPILIYILSYSPMFLHGYGWNTFIGMQKQMWWYHSGLEATHPYESSWWTWPLNLRPVYLYQFDDGASLGNIYAMGNPFFFWFGLASIFYSLYLLIRRKANKKLAVILFGYLIFFAPWAASPRIMFIYHYLPSLPFLAIILAYSLKKNQRLILPALLTIFIAFLYFYPHWTGMHISPEISKSYYWLKSWR